MNIKRPMRLGAIATLAMCSVLSIEATAKDWYIGGSLGLPFSHTLDIDPTDIKENGAATGITSNDIGKWQFRPTRGLEGMGIVGMYLRPDLRLEGELSLLGIWDGEARGEQFSKAFRGTSGSLTRTRVMFNLIKDFPEFSDLIVPFVGVGIGWSWYDADKLRIQEDATFDVGAGPQAWNAVHELDGQDDHFTYAFYAGANFKLRHNLFLTTRYAATSREELSFRGREIRGTNLADPGRTETFLGKIDDGFSHTLSVGLTYKFGQREETYKY